MVTLPERLDTQLLEVFELEVFENGSGNVVHAELLHNRVFEAKPDHPIRDLPGRPRL